MSNTLINYIRTHKEVYRLLRDDSTYYSYLLLDESKVHELSTIAKEKYGLRYIDKLNKISNSINIISSLLDVFK